MGVILANNLKIFQIYMIITKYYISIRVLNMITKLMSIICKDQGEGVVMLKPLNIWNLCAQSSRSRLRHVSCQRHSLRYNHGYNIYYSGQKWILGPRRLLNNP